MTPETGKRIVDYLLDLYEQNTSDFVNQDTKAVVLDFIGNAISLLHRLPEFRLPQTVSCGSVLKRSTFLKNIMK